MAQFDWNIVVKPQSILCAMAQCDWTIVVKPQSILCAMAQCDWNIVVKPQINSVCNGSMYCCKSVPQYYSRNAT